MPGSNVKLCCPIITHCPAKDELKTNIKHHNQQNEILPALQNIYSNKTGIKMCEKLGINIVKSLKSVSEKFMAAASACEHQQPTTSHICPTALLL